MSKARIAEIRHDADQAVKAIDAQQIPDDVAVLDRRDTARSAAVTVRSLAREPITIGVVGEFSAGKSLLIGTLLGKPDLLPVAGQPVTGNITALKLLPGSGEVTTSADKVSVEYLTRERLIGAANHMVKRLAEAAKNVPDMDTTALADLDAAHSGFFGQVEAWCRKLWTGVAEHRERNPDVLHSAWELMRLDEAVRNADSLIGDKVEVSTSFAHSALELGDRPPIPGDFPAPKGRPVDRDSITTSHEDLRATFPLIHRVVYRVEVPAKIWDLSGLRDENEVMLLDFPGLNSDASHNRDEYLSTSELENVSTIMIVVKGDNPGAKGPSRFYGMMQAAGRDRAALAQAILIAGNRFDQVPAPRPAESERVDIESLVSEDLRRFRITVRELTDDPVRRCQIVSAIGGMDYYKLDYTNGTSETRAKIATAMDGVGGKLAQWVELARRMEQASPGDPWAAQLRSLGEDGGIAALRALIENHARERGLGLKTEVLERHHRTMVTAVQRFARSIDHLGGSEAAARADSERVAAFLRSVSTSMATANDHVAVFTAAERLRVEDATPPDIGGPLLQALRTEAVRRVYRWRDWGNILDRAEDFVVPRRTKTDKGPLLNLPKLRKPVKSDTDTTTELYVQFQAVVSDVGQVARRAVGQVARQWVDARTEERDVLRDSYSDPDLHDLVEREIERMEPDAEVRESQLAAVDYALDLEVLAQQLTELIDGMTLTSDIADRFPLIVPHLLPWHAGAPEDGDLFSDEFVRHQQQVFRMRRAIANAAGGIVVEHARSALNMAAAAVLEYINLVQGSLPDANRVPPPPVAPPNPDADPADRSGPVHALLAEWNARR